MSFEYTVYLDLFYITFTYKIIYYNYIHLISVTLFQNDQYGQYIQQSQMYFLFCQMHDIY